MKLRFIFSEVGKGLSRNRAMSVAVILVTYVSLLFVGIAGLSQMQVSKMRTDWYDKIEVSVYMCAIDDRSENCNGAEATEEQIAAVRARLDSQEMGQYVQQYYEESKEEAYENFVKLNGDSNLGQWTTPDMLQVSFRIKLTDPSDYKKVTETLTGRPGVETVEDQSQQVDPLIRVLDRLSYVSAGLAVVMVVVALLLIPTTIRLSAMSRRDETEIMRYVGASNFFIELPFILEGAAAALIGSLLAVGGLWAAVVYFIQEWLSDTVTWIRQIQTSDLFVIAPWLVVGAVLVAASASWITLRRYAKV